MIGLDIDRRLVLLDNDMQPVNYECLSINIGSVTRVKSPINYDSHVTEFKISIWCRILPWSQESASLQYPRFKKKHAKEISEQIFANLQQTLSRTNFGNVISLARGIVNISITVQH